MKNNTSMSQLLLLAGMLSQVNSALQATPGHNNFSYHLSLVDAHNAKNSSDNSDGRGESDGMTPMIFTFVPVLFVCCIITYLFCHTRPGDTVIENGSSRTVFTDNPLLAHLTLNQPALPQAGPQVWPQV